MPPVRVCFFTYPESLAGYDFEQNSIKSLRGYQFQNSCEGFARYKARVSVLYHFNHLQNRDSRYLCVNKVNNHLKVGIYITSTISIPFSGYMNIDTQSPRGCTFQPYYSPKNLRPLFGAAHPRQSEIQVPPPGVLSR